MVNPIDLTKTEKVLLDRINASHPGYDGDAAYKLIESLRKRDAIPRIRKAYFTEGDLNIEGRGKSRKNIFERNGTKGDDIYRHPHFFKFLKYFIGGPDLPQSVIVEFADLVKKCEPVTSGDQEDFCKLARQQVRNHELIKKNNHREVAEEYFKLGLELNLDVNTARAIRGNVMKLR